MSTLKLVLISNIAADAFDADDVAELQPQTFVGFQRDGEPGALVVGPTGGDSAEEVKAHFHEGNLPPALPLQLVAMFEGLALVSPDNLKEATIEVIAEYEQGDDDDDVDFSA